MFPIVVFLLHELAFFFGGAPLVSCVKKQLGAQIVEFKGIIERLFRKSRFEPRGFGSFVVI